MNQAQQNAAMQAMIQWLSHPQELGKAPAKIQCAGTFERYGMRYYLFQYKKSTLGKWLLGVCGGYEGDSLEHCGHIFSEMQEYDPATAVEQATAMVEMIRAYWMEQAKQAEEHKEHAGTFLGFVLLSDASWDRGQLIRDLKESWGLDAEEDGQEDREDALVFSVGEMMAALSLMPAPIPDGEAQENAKNNYMWPQAVPVAQAHRAHIMVAVLGKGGTPLERGKLFVKLVASCCRQKNATGVYTSGTVFEPRFYEGMSGMLQEGELPIFNWIWFGLYRSDKGVCGYTDGLKAFGKDELEVLDADAQPVQVRDFMASLASYLLECDVTLQDGETIGFSQEDKHAITRSQGVALPGMTLKIAY